MNRILITLKNNIHKQLLIFGIYLTLYIGCKKEERPVEQSPSYFGTWELKNSAQITRRAYPVGASLNGKGYIGLGQIYSTSVIFLKDWWEYDPLANTWTQKTNFIGNSDNTQKAFATLSKVYVIDAGHIYSYDTNGNSWLQLNDFPGIKRASYLLISADSGCYLGLGTVDTFPQNALNDWWKYKEDSDSWSKLTDFPGSGLNSTLGFLIDNKIYVGMGGYYENSSYTNEMFLWCYSISSDQWTSSGAIPQYNSFGYGFTLNGNGFFTGGVLPIINKELNVYDPVSNNWSSFSDNKFCPGSAFFIINNKLYLLQSWFKYGTDTNPVDDKFWMLTP